MRPEGPARLFAETYFICGFVLPIKTPIEFAFAYDRVEVLQEILPHVKMREVQDAFGYEGPELSKDAFPYSVAVDLDILDCWLQRCAQFGSLSCAQWLIPFCEQFEG